jgi:hypothetical protein
MASSGDIGGAEALDLNDMPDLPAPWFDYPYDWERDGHDTA